MSDTVGAGAPRKRATDDLRNATVGELSAALSRGQLTLVEFEERSTLAYSARFMDELQDLIADVRLDASPSHFALQAPGTATPGTATPGAGTASGAVALIRSRITGQPGGSGLSLSLMGGATRAGNWLCPSSHSSITVMGGNVIDLREATFESGEIRITAFALMGGIEIIVPEGVRVRCDGVGIMGAFEASVDKTATVQPGSLPADAPTVQVSGVALMGGVSVVTRPRDYN
ncbi:DUF1707 SHOCT-like domain-containing protein [Corynebacterium pacaense]|uniref:DUF1707 SHOCT-like domain-containing protein n=1 Tax=Corynebacterium pacaense TaxID=1816684 RepID=UPI0009B9EA63|nr:DUF1707 domain-containing protein [Corynebacterium pacaense]